MSTILEHHGFEIKPIHGWERLTPGAAVCSVLDDEVGVTRGMLLSVVAGRFSVLWSQAPERSFEDGLQHFVEEQLTQALREHQSCLYEDKMTAAVYTSEIEQLTRKLNNDHVLGWIDMHATVRTESHGVSVTASFKTNPFIQSYRWTTAMLSVSKASINTRAI